jgi:DNA segregation ATPase FtsK/SpoIIIE-like protein
MLPRVRPSMRLCLPGSRSSSRRFGKKCSRKRRSDPLYKEAVDLVRREGRCSVSMLQRRMRIGYTRAARLVDTMEEKGIVSAPQGGSGLRDGPVLDYGPAWARRQKTVEIML